MKRETMMMVEWTDSSSQEGWHNDEDRVPLSNVVSVGFLTYESPEIEPQTTAYITLTASIDEEAGGPNVRASRLGASISIPRFAIKTMTELTPKRGSGANGKLKGQFAERPVADAEASA